MFGFEGGLLHSFNLSGNDSIRYIRVFVGDIIDSIQIGIGKMDNSNIKFQYRCGGGGGIFHEWWVPEDDWITQLEVRRNNSQRIVCGMKFVTIQGRTKEF